jgi:tetratricopeptide (TPR) repeat protein
MAIARQNKSCYNAVLVRRAYCVTGLVRLIWRKTTTQYGLRNTIYRITEKEMKSDHRHELKTNELAEWLGNLPEWTKENLVTIGIVVGVIVLAGALYGWRIYSRNVLLVREQAELTNLLNQISGGKMQILQGQESQGRDWSFLLLQPANNLQTFAKKTSHKRMAALALIKRAEALRAELHYGSVEEQYLANQTNLAKASYAEALEKCPTIPSLAATAKFGLGLCEEELGNFGQARQMYQDIAANSDFENTLGAVQAKRRLETMADYQQNIVFKPSPKVPESMTQTIPTGTGQLSNIIPPFNIYRPLEFDMLPKSKEPDEAKLPVDANVPGK